MRVTALRFFTTIPPPGLFLKPNPVGNNIVITSSVLLRPQRIVWEAGWTFVPAGGRTETVLWEQTTYRTMTNHNLKPIV